MYLGKIIRIHEGSLAEELGLTVGDKVLEVNGQKLKDIIDFSFAFAEEEIDLLIEHADGEQEIISFDKDIDEELGCEFQSAVFDGIRTCANHCYFCFVDMIAPNMRNTLSVKDDDYRMSFLYGNFVTLTNLGERDYQRIEQYHLSPLFVSVQTMNPKLRAEMLRCKGAAKINEALDRLEQAGADYHTQVVLCAGLNDGEELERTIWELMERRPHVLSLAIVPVGITKHRTDPFPLRQFDREGAARVIEQVEAWQEKMRNEMNCTFLYLGDEFYFLAGRELPPAEYYDGFPQLDNGIGITRNFMEEWAKTEILPTEPEEFLQIDVITGVAVSPVMQKLAHEVELENLSIRVLPVENDYFGTTVNVSGLLTGRDIMRALENAPEERRGILIPESALRAGEDVFLDDISLDDLRAQFPTARIEPVQSGADYRRALTDWKNYHKERSRAAYAWQSNAGYTKT